MTGRPQPDRTLTAVLTDQEQRALGFALAAGLMFAEGVPGYPVNPGLVVDLLSVLAKLSGQGTWEPPLSPEDRDQILPPKPRGGRGDA